MRHFRIAWAMVAIAIAAFDLGAIRVVHDHSNRTSYLLGIGAMPMMNVLALGLLFGCGRDRSRNFCSGFIVFGGIASAIYIVAVSIFGDELVIPYLRLLYEPLTGNAGILLPRSQPSYFAIYYLILAMMLALPQLVFALIGGFLSSEIRSSHSSSA